MLIARESVNLLTVTYITPDILAGMQFYSIDEFVPSICQ